MPRKTLRSRFSRWIDRSEMSDSAVAFTSAVVAGVGAGFGAVFFRWLIQSVRQVGFGSAAA